MCFTLRTWLFLFDFRENSGESLGQRARECKKLLPKYDKSIKILTLTTGSAFFPFCVGFFWSGSTFFNFFCRSAGLSAKPKPMGPPIGFLGFSAADSIVSLGESEVRKKLKPSGLVRKMADNGRFPSLLFPRDYFLMVFCQCWFDF